MKKIVRNLRRDFTEQEIQTMTDEVMNNINKIEELTEEKKQKSAAYSKQINGLHQDNLINAKHIQDGHIFTDVACEVEYNKPKDGIKTITRTDTNEQWEEVMAEHEYNLENLPPLFNDGSNNEDATDDDLTDEEE